MCIITATKYLKSVQETVELWSAHDPISIYMAYIGKCLLKAARVIARRQNHICLHGIHTMSCNRGNCENGQMEWSDKVTLT